jgi:predicted transcriptional regulator YheO
MSDTTSTDHVSEEELLLRESEKIAIALGRMFPGICEVVLHDLRDPTNTIRVIENPLSGRQVGDPATELGLARINDPQYPSVVQNYPNAFPDGRPVKSTSIGITNSSGSYIAALCLNLDLTPLTAATRTMQQLARTEEPDRPLTESLRARTVQELRSLVEEYAAARGAVPRALNASSKKELVRTLREDGYLDLRHSVQVLTEVLGISRATVYNYAGSLR